VEEAIMSWSVTVNNLQEYDGFDLETQQLIASQHAAYVRDADLALALARAAGLMSATLSGGRTPNPYTGDEITDISVRGTTGSSDFLSEMRDIITSGPGEGSPVARHYAALARLRAQPCSHVFAATDVPGVVRCVPCGVFLNGNMLYFEEDDGQPA
jgi:hypothetical protein